MYRMCEGVTGPRRGPQMPLKLETQVVMSYTTWVLGTDTGV